MFPTMFCRRFRISLRTVHLALENGMFPGMRGGLCRIDSAAFFVRARRLYHYGMPGLFRLQDVVK